MFSVLSLSKLRPICLKCVKFTKNIEFSVNSMTKSSPKMNVKYLSTHEEYKKKYNYDLPPLMKFKPKPMPNLFYSLKNQLIIRFFLKPLIDKEFDSKTFLNGAKQALSVISSNLANDNIEGIKEMVTNEAYEEVSENFSNFTEKQKQLLKVDVEDILFSFLYNIEIERKSPDSVLVKIFVVFDVLPEYKEILRMESFTEELKFFDFTKYLELKTLCNYEFIRKYIKGVHSEWIVSKLNHIKDKDVLKYYQINE